MPDLQTLYLNVIDHDVVALGECLVAFVGHDVLRQVLRERPRVADALHRDMLVDAAIFREWILNVGQRDALTRTAHLFVEIFTRLKLVGRVRDGVFDFPISQTQLGDALGISAIHTNRVLREACLSSQVGRSKCWMRAR